MAVLRETRDPAGRTIAERGIDRVATGERNRTGLRFLALVGCLNAVYLLGLEIPMQFFALRAGSWPRDITTRTYLVNGVCGPGTGYSCPGDGVPVARR
jgi:hypothetical protein